MNAKNANYGTASTLTIRTSDHGPFPPEVSIARTRQ